MITQKLLQEKFEYKDGNLIYKIVSSKRKKIGDIAGTPNKGYIEIQIDGKKNQAHRLIYIYHNGEIPDGFEIDHINNLRYDNRIENLRLLTHSQNCKNRPKRKNNT